MMKETISPNLGLDLVRVTEAAALIAGRWMGLGKPDQLNQKAAQAMAQALSTLDIRGHVVVGEEGKSGRHTNLDSGTLVGSGQGPLLDVVADPVDGAVLLSQGRPNAIAVAGMAPRGSMWSPAPAAYMEKIVVDQDAAEALVPECMDAPAAWTLALIARVKKKNISDLVVFVLDRPRHKDLIDEIRTAGARIMLQEQGDVSGGLMAASKDVNVDILMGTGGVAEGVISACAIKSLRGAMLGRLAPQSPQERAAVQAAGMDTKQILSCDELVAGEDIYFAATGITAGVLLSGIRYRGHLVETESLVIRCRTGTRRIIRAEHLLEESQ
ncbi:MAG: class II fructose-bisphosphatase [Anaerolineales bacterium]|nr:class II fructose-bisphosphatase [Anaerolineales bacterium]